MELAIDTSSDTASISLSSDEGIVSELTWYVGQNHTSELVPHLNYLLNQAKLTLEDINAIVVATGPGSFNGLRVGMSVAKGLAFAMSVPMVGISTLEVEAFPYAAFSLPVCPILNAGRGEIATALYKLSRGKWRRLREEHITTLDNLIDEIKNRTIFCGSIPPDVESRLRETLKNKALLINGIGTLRRSGYLAALGRRRLKDKDFDEVSSLQPLYLRMPSITVSRRWQNIISSDQQAR